jgi:hypothetical protein
MQGHAMRIGLDLDNTLICYDQAFLRVGKEEGILSASFEGNKAAVKRALLVERPDGALCEALQGLVYGRRIDAEMLFDGVAEFLGQCRRHADSVAIVSHKTERAHYDPETDLRVAALQWMESRQFFEASGLGLERGNVYFEGTRDDKVRRIRELGCDVFIDDLAEVLVHGEMPAACRKILFSSDQHGGFEQYASWREVCDALFPTS